MAGMWLRQAKNDSLYSGKRDTRAGLVRRIRHQHRGEHAKSLVMDKSPGRARRESGKPNGRDPG
jgi:hypothetical protein